MNWMEHVDPLWETYSGRQKSDRRNKIRPRTIQLLRDLYVAQLQIRPADYRRVSPAMRRYIQLLEELLKLNFAFFANFFAPYKGEYTGPAVLAGWEEFVASVPIPELEPDQLSLNLDSDSEDATEAA